jgi:hypothetical protein
MLTAEMVSTTLQCWLTTKRVDDLSMLTAERLMTEARAVSIST